MTRLPRKMKAFLAAYANCGKVNKASKAIKQGRQTHFTWMKRYPVYRQLFAKAHETAMSKLEDMAQHLATIGEEEIVVHDGQPVFVWRDVDGKIVPLGDPTAVHREVLIRRKVVPSLLIFKLKGEFPEKYGDKHKVDVTTAGQSLNQPHPTQRLMQKIMADPAAYEAAAMLADRLQAAEGNGSPSSN